VKARDRDPKSVAKGRGAQSLRAAIAVGLALLAGATAGEYAEAAVGWTGAGVVTALQTRRLSLEGATLKGDLDFRGFDVVKHPLSCRNCTIEGRILADDVVFDATLDLSGVEISGPVLMRRATARAPVLFGPTSGDSGRASVFGSGADFGFTRFEDLATFADASFAKTADFTTTRFNSAVFADATFEHDVLFDRTTFGGEADFRDGAFNGTASFAAAQFDDRAEFSNATFARLADFGEARFGRDATFLGTLFTYGGGERYGVTFGGAVSERDLVFDLAQFSGGGIFRQTVAGRTLSFAGADLASTRKFLVFDRSSAEGISMDVDDALAVVAPEDREHVLRLIETGAKASGDLGVANDARFSIEMLESRDEAWWRRAMNLVFYRLIAGYFVRPFHPLAALFLLAGLVSIWRVARSRAAATGLVRRARIELSSFGREFVGTLTLIGRGGGSERDGRRVETFAYRVLVVCALICLGNSNPTLREMFDAVV
jgi:hypothetical protein